METGDFQMAKEHQPKLVRRRHAYQAVHGAGALGRFNTWVAVRITSVVGSMWCAYVFAGISLISLPAAIHTGDPIVIVAWIAQTFLQLVLLPIIIVGQNVQAAASEGRAEADHKTLTAIHSLAAAIHTLNEGQNMILDRLDEGMQKLQATTPAP